MQLLVGTSLSGILLLSADRSALLHNYGPLNTIVHSLCISSFLTFIVPHRNVCSNFQGF